MVAAPRIKVRDAMIAKGVYFLMRHNTQYALRPHKCVPSMRCFTAGAHRMDCT
jgi:hypothetical protein